jgi:hypothetical protein
MGSTGARNTAALECSGARNGAGSPNTTGYGDGSEALSGYISASGFGYGGGEARGDGRGVDSFAVRGEGSGSSGGGGFLDGTSGTPSTGDI